ncbi:hypothetical protein [Peribacillus frigoritolerans]|uniref:hypothetical protein n=1 Tax=Peribacillus frigoritolerans TaxID=450367 RepID=UPI00227FA8EC|nr:hypothetical protein [Peribacillus frigoritolerans]MCY8940244.1 hypothetical protein [Peribacillus frigoritolerans]
MMSIQLLKLCSKCGEVIEHGNGTVRWGMSEKIHNLRGNGYFVNEPNYELMAKAFTELYFSFTKGGSGDVEFDKLGTIALFSALANDEEGKQMELDKMRAHVKRLKNEKRNR